MKRILTITSFLWLLAAGALIAHSLLAVFSWEETDHDFGKIQQGKPVVAEFSFSNKGGVPLVISNAKGSCGCTGVDYPKEAIMPGKTGKIKATFNAAAIGSFNKTVTVESNAEGGTKVLTIKGEVVR
ncbi:DUF1573 domain-containing protein [Larkinella rosea]|uniref:DUF1573 domain-containing protein n=1 Tax=Larkinella rosea TaxID=2025312 RepID=A0A3P1BFF1_9BACT|nr:DUF1573 domain-containing protein [Larkinella rosea]RRA99799.1 DUF1573 domain-containing protein [Larkinella rosea]